MAALKVVHFAQDRGDGQPAGSSLCKRRVGGIGNWTDDVMKVEGCYDCLRAIERALGTNYKSKMTKGGI